MLSDNRLRLSDAAVNKIKTQLEFCFKQSLLYHVYFTKVFPYIKTIIQSGETFSVISQD